jgi:hypothetical protein
MDEQELQKALTIVQMMNMSIALAQTIKAALANGQTSVTREELRASFAANDVALENLDLAIARAEAEGP